jgi:hypothetical protein
MVKEMVKTTKVDESLPKEDQDAKVLVVCNSFSIVENDEIEGYINGTGKRAILYEIDRLPSDVKMQYLNCFHHVYATGGRTPMIFSDGKYNGNFDEFKRDY